MIRSNTALNFEVESDGLEEIETKLFVEGVRLRYGYDFREYAAAPFRRSLITAMTREGVPTISAFQDKLLRDPACMQRFLGAVGVTATGMFREPELVRAIRDEVVPLFRTYPSVRIWIVGCATGEEAYSLGVVLKEEGVLHKCSLYATDLNDDMLASARLGTYPIDRMRRYSDAYHAAGGRGELSDHYFLFGRNVRFGDEISSSITWARHNLVTDGSFNEFHLIVCANVLIYFRATLQERVHRLLYVSLVRGGFLALGRRESLMHCIDRDHYEQPAGGVNLFRKMRW